MAPPIKAKESTVETDPTQIGKTLVILAKPPDKNKASSSITSAPVRYFPELAKPTTQVQKSLGDQDVNSSTGAPSTSSGATKEMDSFQDLVKNVARVYHVQQKPTSESEQKVLCPPEMSFPVKLVDESLQWCDNALEYLQDANDFYVIGVLGLQGVGKSTIMSIISGIYAEVSSHKQCKQLFKAQTNDLKEIGEHCTTGIDMYVTSQRIILLDTQPVMSASVMDHMIQYEKKPLGGPDYHSAENALLMQSLQQAAFLMAVCHTLVTVQDWFIDLHYLRFLLSAEMLKPSTPINLHDPNTLPEETSEYYPHIVFVQNKCEREDFYPDSVAKMQNTLYMPLQRSKLKFSGSLQNSFQKQKDKVNLFLLPKKDNSEFDSPSDRFPEYKGHPGFRCLADSLRHQVLSMPRSLLTHTALSEKNWFHYSARIWDTVKKSNLFLEYNRLLP